MNILNFPPARGKANIDGGGSATAFSAVTGARWVLTHGFISWANVTSSVTVSLYEIDAANSGVLSLFMVSTTSGFININLGEIGVQASTTGTRLMFNTGAIAATIAGLFAGYYTGS
jgi:hypothetical protein